MGYNDEFAGSIVLDVETVACPDAASLLDPVRAPSNYKDPAKIAAYQTEKLAERVETAGLEADLCEVVAVGFLVEDAPVRTATREEVDEADLLELVWQHIRQRRIVGFNVLGFDLPVLIRRSQLLGITVPHVNLDRYRTPHVDLMERLTFNGKLTTRSLAFYCRRFGISCDDTVNGSDIARLVAEGDWSAVEGHVRADVIKTAALAKRLGYLSTVNAEVLA